MAKSRESFLRRQRERKRQEKAALKREKRFKRRSADEDETSDGAVEQDGVAESAESDPLAVEQQRDDHTG